MKALLNQITKGLQGPTAAQLREAEVDFLSYCCHGNPTKGYLSKNREVYRLQVKSWAYSLVLRSKRLGSYAAEETMTPEELELKAIQEQVLHDYRVSFVLMGADSIFSNVSLYDKDTIETSVVRYLKQEFPYSGKRNCLLIGGTGSGKTFGAIGYVAQHANVTCPALGEPFVNAVFMTAYKLSELLSRRQFDELQRLEKVQFLIVDDLGAEPEGFKGKDFVAHFENLFITRHQHRRTTIITSNSTKAQIVDAYGDRFISRLRETGTMFETSDPDMRKVL